MKRLTLVLLMVALGVAISTLLAESPRAQVSTTSAPQPPRDLPPGELGKVVQLGREIVEKTNTHPLSKAYVGNDLTCSSCHLKAGTHPEAATFLGVATSYPAWSPREGRVITLEDRSLNCFMRSMNGVRPPLGSEVSVAITAYITWLSSELPVRMNAKKPLGPFAVKPLAIDVAKANIERGRKIYQHQCADCHGDDGAGGDEGPPVWGERSFNQGAGLSQNDKLAAWLKVAMPLDEPHLSEQEALDVAAFINSHPRPKFVLKDHLPPADRLGEFNQQTPSDD